MMLKWLLTLPNCARHQSCLTASRPASSATCSISAPERPRVLLARSRARLGRRSRYGGFEFLDTEPPRPAPSLPDENPNTMPTRPAFALPLLEGYNRLRDT